MVRFMLSVVFGGAMIVSTLAANSVNGTEITGHYLEARTCQVYTGPCFANGEVGITGKDAVMAWSIQRGALDGVDLAGLNVAVVVRASDTLAFRGLEDPREMRAMIVVDDQASQVQRDALVAFAKAQTGKAGNCVEKVKSAPFDMKMNETALTAKHRVGEMVKLEARKARPDDCICSNESAYYPPLTKLQGFVPGVTIEGQVKAQNLGTRWSIPDSRTSYLGTFSVQ